MAIVPILSGSAIGKSLQLNVDMLGGIRQDNTTGRYDGIAVFTGSAMGPADDRQYLSASFGNDAHTIIQAMNHLKATQTANASQGSQYDVQLADGDGGFTYDADFSFASNVLEIHSNITAAGASTYATTAGDITLDSAAGVNLDAADGDIEFKVAGTAGLAIDLDNVLGPAIQLKVDSDDLVFKQFDGTTVLTLDDDTTVKVATDLTVGDDLSLTSDSAVFNMGAGNDFTITHDGTTGATIAGNPITITAAGASTWSTSAGALTVDAAAAALTLDGHTGVTVQSSNSGDITLDSVAGVNLDAADGDVEFKVAGTSQLKLDMDGATGPIVQLMVDADDLVFKQYDGTASLTVKDDASVEVATDLKVGDDLSLTSDSAVFNMGAGNDFTITHDGTTGATIAGNPITITAAGASTWSTSAGALTIDAAAAALTLDGHSGVTVQSTNAGNITLDSVADIVLDAAGNDVLLKAGGTTFGGLSVVSEQLAIYSGDTPTLAVQFNSANADFAGTVDITGKVTCDADFAVATTSVLTGDATFGGNIVADAAEAKAIFTAAGANLVTIGGSSGIAAASLTYPSLQGPKQIYTTQADQTIQIGGSGCTISGSNVRVNDGLKIANSVADGSATGFSWSTMPKLIIQGTAADGKSETFHVAVSGGILRAIAVS